MIMFFVVDKIDTKRVSAHAPHCNEKTLLQGGEVTPVSHLGRGDKLCGSRSNQRTGMQKVPGFTLLQ